MKAKEMQNKTCKKCSSLVALVPNRTQPSIKVFSPSVHQTTGNHFYPLMPSSHGLCSACHKKQVIKEADEKRTLFRRQSLTRQKKLADASILLSSFHEPYPTRLN